MKIMQHLKVVIKFLKTQFFLNFGNCLNMRKPNCQRDLNFKSWIKKFTSNEFFNDFLFLPSELLNCWQIVMRRKRIETFFKIMINCFLFLFFVFDVFTQNFSTKTREFFFVKMRNEIAFMNSLWNFDSCNLFQKMQVTLTMFGQTVEHFLSSFYKK